MVAEDVLACKNFDFLKTNTIGRALEATHCTSMVAGHNRFPVLADVVHLFLVKLQKGYRLERGI